jgi:hypothetical protein
MMMMTTTAEIIEQDVIDTKRIGREVRAMTAQITIANQNEDIQGRQHRNEKVLIAIKSTKRMQYLP